ncbi:fibronectin type III domain-containing protein [Streptomyces sp. ODS05-4]|uniref:fibronectin type III domain-containing protein n=1 Tax=Streptomyces sp. ODS05-4 TaxID=2944939 RepID=UPI0021096F53|nr:fibronectin type III domain-containing protein [Streptomyces sp. ODS05-4]
MRRTLALSAVPACAAALLLTGCSGGADAAPKDTEPPAVPAGVTVQASSATSAHVMWERAADAEGVAGYEVFQRGARVKALPAAKTMVDVESLTPGTAYEFTVRAKDAAGNLSAPSKAVSVTTPQPKPDDRRPPSVPGAPRGTVESSRAVTLSWRAAEDDTGVTAYDVYQEDSRIHSVPGTATSARVEGLRPGQVYSFTVRARDAADNSSPDSAVVDLTTRQGPGGDAPTAPTGLTATPGKGEVVLRWTPPETGGPVTEHQLYLNGKFATTIVWGGEPPAGQAAYTFAVSDPPGTRYSVKIRAKLPDGAWGDFSAQRTVVIPPGA